MEQPRSIAGSQAAAGAAGNMQPSPAHSLPSKKASDHLANERTFLAWVRTGLATITFGFVVERLPFPASLAGGKTQPGTQGKAILVGLELPEPCQIIPFAQQY